MLTEPVAARGFIMALHTYNPHGDDDLRIAPPATAGDDDMAVGMIRDKLARIYDDGPAAKQELSEAEETDHRSKHQQFMYQLGTSGKSLAAVQTEWHDYYQGLSDDEKRQVWQEFYDSQPNVGGPAPASADSGRQLAEHKQPVGKKQLQAAVRQRISGGGKLQAKHHLQSLLFGLALGLVAVIIFLFGFFNQVFIAPFIQPSRASAATPIILSTSDVAPTPTPEVIIPKINVEIPVDYSETSTNEADIENDLQSGVVHYPTTVLPGQDGNTAFFGHSSNNIFNSGRYKFAFVLLHTLVDGDTFYLTYNDKVYVYKVISHTIVSPNDVGVLGPVAGQTATATLITCDPPGTSINRLVVVGQQISPDPSGNATAAAATVTPLTTLPGNGPTAWTSFIRTAFGKLSTIAILAAVLFVIARWINQPLRHARKLGL